MTVAVGVLCEDGVVVGSDSSGPPSATNLHTLQRPLERTLVVGKDVIVAGTGPAGLTQRFKAVVSELREDSRFAQLDRLVIAKNVSAAAIEDFASTQCPKQRFAALVAFTCRGGFHLCEFASSDLQPEIKTPDMWFASLGSGQSITDSLLALIRKVFFKASPPRLNEGVFAATWALVHAIELNTGGIQGPPQIAVLRRDLPELPFSAHLLTEAELYEHIDNVRGAEEHLGSYRRFLSGEGGQPIPELDL